MIKTLSKVQSSDAGAIREIAPAISGCPRSREVPCGTVRLNQQAGDIKKLQPAVFNKIARHASSGNARAV
jgi:hypothetical protein